MLIIIASDAEKKSGIRRQTAETYPESFSWFVTPAQAGVQIPTKHGFRLSPERRNKKVSLVRRIPRFNRLLLDNIVEAIHAYAAANGDRNAAPFKSLQKQFDAKLDSEAKAAGVTPIRVRLPSNGRQFYLEKILALPGDPLYFDVDYSDWKAAK